MISHIFQVLRIFKILVLILYPFIYLFFCQLLISSTLRLLLFHHHHYHHHHLLLLLLLLLFLLFIFFFFFSFFLLHFYLFLAVGLSCEYHTTCQTMANGECRQGTCSCKDDFFLDSTNSSNCIPSE